MSRRLSRRERRLLLVEGFASGIVLSATLFGVVIFMMAW